MTRQITTLAYGKHHSPDQGMCLLEAVAYVAGEPFTDHPACASPILGAFGRALNDVLPAAKRQELIPLVPLIVGTAGDGKDQTRGLMAADWLIRVYTPTWLRLAGLDDAALSLENLPRQASWDDVEAAVPVVRQARKVAAAVGDAAWDAARDAARAAAWAAVGDAAWDAAWDAARAAVGAAVGAAAGDAAGAAVGAAAWDAARAAAWDAAWDAAWAAAGDAAWAAAGDAAGAAVGAAAGDAAGAAVGAAAGAALAPTVTVLQDSAIALFQRMITADQ